VGSSPHERARERTPIFNPGVVAVARIVLYDYGVSSHCGVAGGQPGSDTTHWDEVVTSLGYEHLRRHDLHHTGLTWMADAGVPVHHLRKIAGHGSLTTTQRYLHPDRQAVSDAAALLSRHLGVRSQMGPKLQAL
jgi:integrase